MFFKLQYRENMNKNFPILKFIKKTREKTEFLNNTAPQPVNQPPSHPLEPQASAPYPLINLHKRTTANTCHTIVSSNLLLLFRLLGSFFPADCEVDLRRGFQQHQQQQSSSYSF